MPSFDLISQLTPTDQRTSPNEVKTHPQEDVRFQTPIMYGKSASSEEDAPYQTPICDLKEPAPLSVDKHKPQENQHRRRTIKLPDIMCSPYAHKKVRLFKSLSREENKIADTIFAAVKNEWNEVFQTQHGAAVPRVSFESLYPNVEVHISVLKCWASVLNSEDKFRNKRDPTRFFCSCNMLGDKDFEKSVEESSRITTFNANMESCLREANMDTLIGIDLVFIPILHSKHYYLICYNLKKALVDVIDNLGRNVEFDSKYAFRPQIMQNTLCNYLEMTSHPIASKLRKCEPKILEMPWRTVNNSVDCGIFVMRHMETYKCTTIKDWKPKCGLAGESEYQKTQLVDLRMKYLAKILLSDINIRKGVVISEVREYSKRPTEEREAMKANMFERITTRVNNAL
ncbi:putative Ulp1 protease family catalytic domain, papain-like cysteine peptidase superfamily [Helianthus annuus]|uniref:Putative ulp1 protease family, C-terminal catalytic domain-containing protein n=1 Tax=Helianthus annuus TaxID=4232 RepID=A0A251TR09_HELAN|nr:putative Ulp1 protease family catalytic domain, papain-like cysteine peptidase superfamily [Helianthus annuus]